MSKKDSSIDNRFCRIPMGDGSYRLSNEMDKINRMVVLGPGCKVSTKELVTHIHMLELPINVRLTCYGAHINGTAKDVKVAAEHARKLDETHIFIKNRGFPVGDPRRCRAKRKGAREGFHQLEAEYEMLADVSYALEHPKHVDITPKKRVSVKEFADVVDEITPKKEEQKSESRFNLKFD
ncbi:MAG: methanogenesis marker 6 protein [Methanosphaera sp.]|uniref:methanogenesis marker 6 protein n=1 Tax=Methanosphaera sp. TaxID=2666342 RepID=UPI0025E71C4E|nr:methanogenesis marker 6 protein [Methanosphaera sp.]MCI5867123.1 methanogenesis marker 6 protein [Methanosphaera sp.]MDD6534808.1 methanogenesis marker 6 protein [Methanosphaera sp.]MDY3955524.1 methanogenesis marker 6 protein [Methanosphaera sp.]